MNPAPGGPAWRWQFGSEAARNLPRIFPLEDLSKDWAWGGSTGKGIRVAVIDSGIDAAHPAVGAVQGHVSITQGANELVFDCSPHTDLYGHGTACAGIIRAVAPECELYSVQVLGPRLTAEGTVFAAGIQWAIEHEMHVCNLSLGTTKRQYYALLHELADSAYHRNIMLVTAANNTPVPSFPSIYASVFSVAAHAIPNSPLFFYNPKPPVEFGAPGIDVRVAWRNGEWITATGNSFAAPHVAGIIARIRSKHPDLTVFHMKSILRALAANVIPPDSGAAL
jgi:subtilisin